MATNRANSGPGMTTKTKITIVLMIIVVLIIIWQVIGLFGGGGSAEPTPSPTPETTDQTAMGGPSPNAPPNTVALAAPKVVNVLPEPTTPEQAELMRLQQATQVKYLQALNELQFLKVSKEIAETNKDISTAKLNQILAEKKIVDTLTPPAPPPPNVDKTIPSLPIPSASLDQEVNYSVVSISQLQNRWAAILNYKGNLYNVHVGDILPPDSSRVTAIKQNSVVLEKEGKKKTVSLVAAV